MSGHTHASQVDQLVDGGASLIQLREKHLSPRKFFEASRDALELARQGAAGIIINDRVDIAMMLGAAGVHIGQDDIPPAAARKILGPDSIIGLSTHSVAQAAEAARQPVDYIAIGPIFKTTSKNESGAALGLETIRRVRQAIGSVPVVAIGGITIDNVAQVLAAGADSAAVIGAIYAGNGPIADRMRSLLLAAAL